MKSWVPTPDDFPAETKAVLSRACEEARRLGQKSVGPEEIFLALLERADGLLPTLLRERQVDLDAIRAAVEKHVREARRNGDGDRDPFTAEARRVLDEACIFARLLEVSPPRPEHLALEILKDKTSPVPEILSAAGVQVDRLRSEILERTVSAIQSRATFPEILNLIFRTNVGDPKDWEELCQELCQDLSPARFSALFIPLLSLIAPEYGGRRRDGDLLRRVPLEIIEEPGESDSGIEGRFLSLRTHLLVLGCIKKLCPHYPDEMAAIYLMYFEGVDVHGLMELLEKGERSVYVLLKQGRMLLRAKVKGLEPREGGAAARP